MKETLLSLTWWNQSTTLEIVSTLMATFQKWTCKSTLSSNRLLTRNFLKKILFTFLRLIYRLNFLFLKNVYRRDLFSETRWNASSESPFNDTVAWRHSALGAKRPKTSPVGAFSALHPWKKNQIKYQTTAWKETSKWASVRWLRFLAPSPGELRSILTPAAGLWKPTDDSRRLPNGNAAFTHQHN